MTAAREAFVQHDAQTIREALAYLFDLAEMYDLVYGMDVARLETIGQRDDALAALDRLEELATA